VVLGGAVIRRALAGRTPAVPEAALAARG